jgi:hypothetical protein
MGYMTLSRYRKKLNASRDGGPGREYICGVCGDPAVAICDRAHGTRRIWIRR